MNAKFLLGAALLITYPLALHFTLIGQRTAWAAVLLSAVLILYLLLVSTRHTAPRVLGFFILAISLPILAYYLGYFIYLIYILPPLIYLLLFWVFVRTLRAGEEPLITRISKIERGGSIPADLLGYTRGLTELWSAFFILMALSSLVLAIFAPLHIWSFFSNILSYLLTAAFFIVEYAIRKWRFPHHSHSSPLKIARRIADNGFRF